jgi:nucleoside-diphosphate-sugar epimerase
MEFNIYGTMDGTNNWARLLNKTFNELRHKRSHADPCMQIQYTKDGGYTISATYTDDVMAASLSNEAKSQTFSETEHEFEVTGHGRPVVILGMGSILHKNSDISIHQKVLT